MRTKKKLPLAAIAAVALSACSSGDGKGARDPVKPAEIEIVTNRYGTTTIGRYRFEYAGDGSQLEEITAFVNGAVAGRLAWTYEGGRVSRVELLDAEGDRATLELEYDKGRLTRRLRTNAQSTIDERLEYDDAHGGRLEQVTTTSGDVTSFTVFDYDEAGRLETVTRTNGGYSTIEELRYDEDDRLERVTSFAGTSLQALYEFEYDPDGRLEEAVGEDDRVTLSYDAEGRVEEVERLVDGGSVRIRYTYEAGAIDGVTFAPDIPAADLFDLRGASFADIDPMHLAASALDLDAPGALPPQCDGYSAENECEECTFGPCCDQLAACLDSSECYYYVDCLQQCTTAACQDDCGYWYPTGASLFSAYVGCAQSYCRTPCNL